MAYEDDQVNNPLTNTCKVFTTGHCNLEEQLDEAKAKIASLENEIEVWKDKANEYFHQLQILDKR